MNDKLPVQCCIILKNLVEITHLRPQISNITCGVELFRMQNNGGMVVAAIYHC